MQNLLNVLPALIFIAVLIIATILLSRHARKEDKRREVYNDNLLHSKKQLEYYKGMKVDNKSKLIKM